jgi:hypothetical protein
MVGYRRAVDVGAESQRRWRRGKVDVEGEKVCATERKLSSFGANG